MARFTGDITIYVDGATFYTKQGTGSVDVAESDTTDVIADGAAQGYFESARAVIVKATAMHNGTVDLIKLSKTRDAKVVVATDDGVRYLVTEAYRVGSVEMSAGGGETPLEFHGTGVQKL